MSEFAVGMTFWPADRGGQAIKAAELAQFGPKHAVILREAPRIVSLHIDDMTVLDAHAGSPD
ncbi:hypothetical protein [Tardiphaga sp. P9-11]|uniref:hypothetical protein n=1 Tax=Tardiphaga sp. P9-11 TaxID=2024614 RepID=UPI0011F122D9|nr:hypothetical protein [Tardiphaga sp. P9-11]